ncbi:MAG: PEP-CTERM sorting domain-containing protein [Alphaproteobacteria bacterium]|nr:PEP-CTERM sorting domain-containing protein [Alphaproteobacteria bacterium]
MKSKFSKFLAAAAFAVGALLAFGTTNASATVINFTDVEAPGVSCCGLVNPNAWSSYGITVSGAYWYQDFRDTFDTMGLSVFSERPSGTGVIQFASPVSNLSVDYWSIGGNSVTVDAYDAFHVLLGTVTIGGPADTFGTTNFGNGVGFLEWSGNTGFAQVSTVSFDSVPEPSTIALILVSFALLAFAAWRRQQTAA